MTAIFKWEGPPVAINWSKRNLMLMTRLAYNENNAIYSHADFKLAQFAEAVCVRLVIILFIQLHFQSFN